MSKTKWALGLVPALVLAYLIASPWITVYRMKWAVDHHDGAALVEHVDLPSVRQGLKEQINGRVTREITGNRDVPANPLAAFGAALAGMMVDKLVDLYVTPAGISELIQGESPQSPLPGIDSGTSEGGAKGSQPKPFERASMGYTAWNEFTVTTKDQGGRARKFVLRRRGLGWKLTDVILPMN